MLKEFKAFLMKHGVVGLAVAVVIGGAVSKVVAALVSEIIMPVIGAMTPGGNWREATLSVGSVKFGTGPFAGSLIDFFIIAVVVFIIVKIFIKEEPAKS
jgi:large conductance mechanosensitive channel